jgi:rRNA maturation RNase YbeY
MIQGDFSIVNLTKMKLPEFAVSGASAFLSLKDEILGKKYSLSLAYVGEKASRELNKKWRGKDKPTNVLSFSLTRGSGEIVICPKVVLKESKDEEKNFNKDFPHLLGFLVIHGMLHLKGRAHGSRMEREEKLYCKKYDKKYFDWNRRGVLNDKSRGGRILKGRKKS